MSSRRKQNGGTYVSSGDSACPAHVVISWRLVRGQPQQHILMSQSNPASVPSGIAYHPIVPAFTHLVVSLPDASAILAPLVGFFVLKPLERHTPQPHSSRVVVQRLLFELFMCLVHCM